MILYFFTDYKNTIYDKAHIHITQHESRKEEDYQKLY